VQIAGEAGSPAFVEDRLVEVFCVAVGLWSAGVDASVSSPESTDGGGEAALELVAVVRT
jgi:hypothetical protein